MPCLRLFAIASTLVLFGCSATTTPGGVGGAGGAGGGGGATIITTGDEGGGGGSITGLGGFGGGGGGNMTVETEVFGHSAVTLYRLDAVTKEVTVVGDFNGCPTAVIDIALDKDGVMIGTTFDGLYSIDKQTAKCAFVASGDFPNSLSFVPVGTVDPSVEALVGYEGSNYVRINPKTGQKTAIGTLNGGYVSSGDIVSVIGGGTYLTVFGGPEDCDDCILEVNPKTGAFIKNVGALGHSSVYGLAFWGGAAYGFDAFGELFQIDLSNGVSTNITVPNAPAGLSFYGAGSSTSVPVEVPE